jgi:hypothetical protein
LKEKAERNMLLYAAELLLDLIIFNDKQTKTGTADIAKYMKDRQITQSDKRVNNKITTLGSITHTEFF